ncbi:hypothetical protein T492DRAFT_454051 [Pavlovales sp. CCMP2436]|nr:hypothetical protein T492DRAFT_454051 [Pavlovales sp. CCMP2436]
MFDRNAEAVSYFEPLRAWEKAGCSKHYQRNQSLVNASIATLNCDFSARVLQKCPCHDQLGLHPLMPLGPLVSRSGESRRTSAQRMGIRQLLRINRTTAPACNSRIDTRRGLIAIKAIRIPGMLNMLLATTARIFEPPGRRFLVLHLIRDPRAPLRSQRGAFRFPRGAQMAFPSGRKISAPRRCATWTWAML